MSYGYVSWTIEHRLNEKIEIYLILGKQATEMIIVILLTVRNVL